MIKIPRLLIVTALIVTAACRRMIALRPETEGHVKNAAVDGSPHPSSHTRPPERSQQFPSPIWSILTIDNDIRCDGTDSTHVVASPNTFDLATGDFVLFCEIVSAALA